MLLLYALYALYGSSILRGSRQKFAIRSASQNNAPHPCSRLPLRSPRSPRFIQLPLKRFSILQKTTSVVIPLICVILVPAFPLLSPPLEIENNIRFIRIAVIVISR
jgi:hypothetical protein